MEGRPLMAARSPARRRLVTRIAATERWNGSDDPRLPELRAELRVAEGADLLHRAAAALDPFAPEQAAEVGRIAAVLDARLGGGESHG